MLRWQIDELKFDTAMTNFGELKFNTIMTNWAINSVLPSLSEDMVHLTKAGRSQRQILDICLTKDSTLLRSGKSVIGGGGDDDNEDDGHCERGLHLDLDSEDEKKREILKWIPYPEPGT